MRRKPSASAVRVVKIAAAEAKDFTIEIIAAASASFFAPAYPKPCMRMNNTLAGIAVLLGLASPSATAAGARAFDHSVWDRVLAQYVTPDGRQVHYAALKQNTAELDGYVAQLAARSPESHPQDFPTRQHQLAYWVNAYNALVIHGVVESWPVESVTKIGLPYSFFWWKKFTVGGRKVTLNYIEHDVLRGKMDEPRVHFVLVCAANSCPRLPPRAATPENVEELLDEATRFFINEPRNLRIEPQRNRVTVSWILTHYDEDFEHFARRLNLSHIGVPLLDYIWLYANAENRRALESLGRNPDIEAFDYDWNINSASE